MRAAAIAFVTLSHVLLVPLWVLLRQHTAWPVMAGYFGVEIFFVLSGFLIGGILIRDFSKSATGGTLVRFWCRRWLRTLPLFYLFVVVNLVIDRAHGGPAAGWWSNLFFLQNLTSAGGPFFRESWSLAVEEWFYLLAPPLIFAGLKMGLPLKRSALAVALGGIACATAWRIYVVGSGHLKGFDEVHTVVTMRLDACMFGVFAAWWNHYAPESWNAWKWGKLGIGLLCLCGAAAMYQLLPLKTSFAAGTHLLSLTSLGAMLCLPSLAALRTPRGKLAQAVTLCSKWSYAMYLVNLPILIWLEREAGRALEEPLTASVAAASGLMFTVIASAALHYFYEMPILRWRDRRLRGSGETGANSGRRQGETQAHRDEPKVQSVKYSEEVSRTA